MKEKPSEWIAVSDLMASLMAVVMLLLVLSVLQKSAAEVSYQQQITAKEREAKLAEQKADLAKEAEAKAAIAKIEAEKALRSKMTQANPDPLSSMMVELGNILQAEGNSSQLISLDAGTNRLVLKDSVFKRGSACVTEAAQQAMESVQGSLSNFLNRNPTARIFVEGYTDDVPVKRPVTDFQRFCTVYDDNFTLSAARAREARRYLIGNLDPTIARRVVVAGYGDSRPMLGIAPSDPRNRRVEVLFLLQHKDKTNPILGAPDR